MTLKFACIFGRKGFVQKSSALQRRKTLSGAACRHGHRMEIPDVLFCVNIVCKHSEVDESLRIFQTLRGKRFRQAGMRICRWKASVSSRDGLEAFWKSSFFAHRDESARIHFHSETERTFKTEDTFLLARVLTSEVYYRILGFH